MLAHSIQIGNIKIGGENPTRIMGIINLSPESFYVQSIVDEKSVSMRIQEMEKSGADMFDVGAASTAPKQIYGTQKITRKKELERVSRILPIIRESTELPISIDTTSADVAKTALDLGADFVNDVSGLRGDPRMAGLIAERNVPVVIMASCNGSCDTVVTTINALKESIEIAERMGIELQKLILDPGIGFGKPTACDVELIRRLRVFRLFGHPILVGVSRKAFIGAILEKPDPNERLVGSIAATAIAVMNGADIIRTHDVTESVDAVKMGLALRTIKKRTVEGMSLFEEMTETEAMLLLEHVGTSSQIRTSLSKKAVGLSILIHGLTPPAAIIIKQEMLAVGGDAAYHYHTIDFGIDRTNVLLMGTVRQLEKLYKKLLGQTHFGLHDVGKRLKRLLTEREQHV